MGFSSFISKCAFCLVVLPEHNREIERRLAEIEGEIIDSFPWLDVDFDIVLRYGRDIRDLVHPNGFQIFGEGPLPTRDEHLDKAVRNEKLAQVLRQSAFPDWAVTVYFYSALHYCHIVLAVYGQHPQSHDATGPLVAEAESSPKEDLARIPKFAYR